MPNQTLYVFQYHVERTGLNALSTIHTVKLWHCETYNGYWTISDCITSRLREVKNETNRNHHYYFPISFAILFHRFVITLLFSSHVRCTRQRICSFIGWFMHISQQKFIWMLLLYFECFKASKRNEWISQFVFLSFVRSIFVWVYFCIIHLPCAQQFCKWFVIGLSCTFVGITDVYLSLCANESRLGRSIGIHVMVFVCILVGCWWKIWILCAIGYELKLVCTTHPIQALAIDRRAE